MRWILILALFGQTAVLAFADTVTIIKPDGTKVTIEGTVAPKLLDLPAPPLKAPAAADCPNGNCPNQRAVVVIPPRTVLVPAPAMMEVQADYVTHVSLGFFGLRTYDHHADGSVTRRGLLLGSKKIHGPTR